MVQRILSGRNSCKPAEIRSENISDTYEDKSNRTRSVPLTDGAPIAASMPFMRNFMDHCNPQVCEIVYRLNSGKVFRMTRAHPDAQEVRIEDFPELPFSISGLEALEGQHCSEKRQTPSLPRAVPHRRISKKQRRGSGSPTSTLPSSRRIVRQRRAVTSSNTDSDSEDEMDGAETEMQWIKVSELHLHYYVTAFRSINQLCCKDIAKAWIAACHPRKQSTHPYNGGKTGSSSELEFGYKGHHTGPDYWPSDENWNGQPFPSGCRHLEPDHLKKPERIILLVHLLRSQYKGFKDGDFSLKQLIGSTDGIHQKNTKHWTAGYAEILQEIHRVRAKEMEFERGEIDGDTLVNVQMPKTRSKVRRASKSTIKFETTPPNKRVKNESEDNCLSAHNAPIANMGISEQSEDECVGLIEGSEPNILADSPDTWTSAEAIAPNVGCPEPTPDIVRSVPHGSTLPTLPPPTSTRLNSAQDLWASCSANLGQDPTISMHPNISGAFITAGEAPGFIPMHDHYPFQPSSMQTISSQFLSPQYDHELTASQRIANRTFPNGTLDLIEPVPNIGPKMETIRHPTFAASSSGLVGAFSMDAQYSGWQTDNLWQAQTEPSDFTTSWPLP